MIYLGATGVFLFSLSLINAVLFSIYYKEKAIEKLKYYEQDFIIKEKKESSKKKKFSLLKLLSKLVPDTKISRKRSKKIEEELIKADMKITAEELFVVKVLSAFSLVFLSYSITKDIFIMGLAYLVIWNIPRFIINKKKAERLKLFNEQINDGIIIISNSLKAGYSFLQAITVVVDETKDPFSKEFKKLLKEMSLGISAEDALKGMLKRVESEDLRLIVNAILIQKDIGGNLSEILDNISDTIRERQKIKNELKTLTAQGKLSGFIVMAMPVFLGIIIYLFNKDYIMLLFTTPAGIGMLVSSFFGQLFGFIFIRKIINVEV